MNKDYNFSEAVLLPLQHILILLTVYEWLLKGMAEGSILPTLLNFFSPDSLSLSFALTAHFLGVSRSCSSGCEFPTVWREAWCILSLIYGPGLESHKGSWVPCLSRSGFFDNFPSYYAYCAHTFFLPGTPEQSTYSIDLSLSCSSERHGGWIFLGHFINEKKLLMWYVREVQKHHLYASLFLQKLLEEKTHQTFTLSGWIMWPAACTNQ